VSDSATPTAPPTWPAQRPERLIVVGVDADQRPEIVTEVAALARTMSAGLVCAWVDSTQVIYGASLDGTRLITPLDPDQAAGSSDAVREQVHQHLAGIDTDWVLPPPPPPPGAPSPVNVTDTTAS